MIEEVRLRSLGVISDAVMELGPGFTVVTGETGAGKTMVVTGLGLLLGRRGDAAAVRSGSDRAVVEGRVRLPADGGDVRDVLAEVDADVDDDATVILARTVTSEGRSRAHVGGRSVPVATLTRLADQLVAVHGQSDQIRLRTPALQRDLVDRYAGESVAGPIKDYRDALTQLRAVDAELAEVVGRATERSQEAATLRERLALIEAVDPQPGEDVDLAAAAERLGHAEELRAAAAAAHAALSGDDAGSDTAPDAQGLLDAARRSVSTAAGFDPTLRDLESRLTDLSALAAEAASDLASYAASIDHDPVRLATVQDRRATLTHLTRSHPPREDGTPAEVDDVLAWSRQAAERLTALDGDTDRGSGLRARRDQLVQSLTDLARTLGQARRDAARRLSDAVGVELEALAMPHARLVPDVLSADPADGAGFGPHGLDTVELLLQPHAGSPARPLSKGASGGELSRVMLALEVVLAGVDPVPTFVFDEVDSGVGGAAAVEIGRRLARLARASQVVVVTHLPQVAAFADRHLVVAKSDDGQVTESGVRSVVGDERVVELARMMAGMADSRTARAHAEELLAAAVDGG